MIEAITVILVILHKLTAPVVIGGIAQAFVHLWVLEAKRQRAARLKAKPKLQAVAQPGTQPPVRRPVAKPLSLPTGWVTPETRKRLLAMCRGDEKLVRRLTGGSGEQADWEKAIYYLERDRR